MPGQSLGASDSLVTHLFPSLTATPVDVHTPASLITHRPECWMVPRILGHAGQAVMGRGVGPPEQRDLQAHHLGDCRCLLPQPLRPSLVVCGSHWPCPGPALASCSPAGVPEREGGLGPPVGSVLPRGVMPDLLLGAPLGLSRAGFHESPSRVSKGFFGDRQHGCRRLRLHSWGSL